jgi:hypothetical protein
MCSYRLRPRDEIDYNGAKFSVELNCVNRKQRDIVVNLPRPMGWASYSYPKFSILCSVSSQRNVDSVTSSALFFRTSMLTEH